LGLVLLAATAPAAAAPAPKQRVVRTWQDTIKTPAGEVARRVEVVFDYATGVAHENAYDASGQPLSSIVLDRQPRPSPEEIQDAIAIMRADASVGRILARTGAVPEGGFVLEEPAGSACGPRTRCLQILLLSPDRHGLQRRVVVDLTKRAIAYRAYVPSDMEKAK
jgi:hypothetical protein